MDIVNYLCFLAAGILAGGFISHYSAYLINKCPDKPEEFKPVVHKYISKRNIIICVLNGIMWEYIYVTNGFSVLTVIYMLVSSMLLCLSVIDLAVFEIPPQFNVCIFLLAVCNLVMNLNIWYEYLIGAVAVSGIFLILALATKGQGMGGGDIKLMFTCGMLLGWKKILFVMFIGAILGSVIHITIMKLSKKEHMLAFGPYLSAGVFIMMCYGNQIVQWYIDNFLTFNNM